VFEVVKIDREKKEIEVKDLNTGKSYRESYDYLVLSPGSTPLTPPIPGIDSPNIFTLWNIPDVDKIKEYVDNKKPKRAVVIGGGFIGLEMAENLYERGIDVSVVEMADQVMAPIDFEMAQIVHEHMRTKDAHLYLKDGVKSFEYKSGVTTVVLQSGKTIEADIVMLSIGVKPQSGLAKDAGLELNQRGGIVVDESLKTSDPSIYALGDAVEVVDFINNTKTMIPLAGPANKQGRIVANNLVGKNETYKETQGTSIAKVFDITVASTGNNEKTLKRMGMKYGKDYLVSIIHSKSHAGYYPGAIPMTIKLLFTAKEGKVLGSQIVGYNGVDKRIDVIATAIRFGATIFDLKELELAYAPPYSSAKDPVNMIGFTAENIINGDMPVINWDEMENLDLKKTIILDVREPIERELGYIEGSINIPVNELRDRLKELDKNKLIVVYCAIGLRGYIAIRVLLQNGFKNVKNFSGGYTTYSCVFCNEEDESAKCGGIKCNPEQNFSDNGEAEEKRVEGKTVKLNACGLSCPGPIMQVYERMKTLQDGDTLEVTATDPGFINDIKTWSRRTGNTLIKTEKREKEFAAFILKGSEVAITSTNNNGNAVLANPSEDKSIIVFSGDLDKAIASFIIANGAAAMGRKVTMFFTFWGLNILRKHEKVNVKKGFMDKMFSSMMPRGSKKLGLSKMNMAGLGAKMIRKVMKDKNINSLEELIQQAIDSGIHVVACGMSMDVMGITEAELIDGVEISGVAAYLGAAEESNVNLFI